MSSNDFICARKLNLHACYDGILFGVSGVTSSVLILLGLALFLLFTWKRIRARCSGYDVVDDDDVSSGYDDDVSGSTGSLPTTEGEP